MNEMAKIELSKDIIEPIVRAQLQASITSALGRSDQLVAGVVQTMMNLKVDDNGNKTNSSYGSPLITWMAEQAIKEAARDAIKEWFAGHRDELKKQIQLAMGKQAKTIAEKFVAHMADTAMSPYRTSIDVKFQPKD